MDRSTSVGCSSRRRAGGAGRFPALAAIVLLGALTTACGEDPPVPVEGSVSGTVTLEGAPLADIHVDLEGAGVDQHVDTDASGAYTIARVIEGTYTVSIEGMPSDTEFEASQTVTISPSSPNATADFAGDYIRTARSKGLAERVVLTRHALRNASVPIMTIVGLSLAGMIGGLVISEQVFAIPGMGRLVVDAVSNRDFPVIQGVLLMVALSYVVVNLVIDLTYVYIDPRIRY